jgi:asparagine N-glycosylation enzyme membrane subunit Stt3
MVGLGPGGPGRPGAPGRRGSGFSALMFAVSGTASLLVGLLLLANALSGDPVDGVAVVLSVPLLVVAAGMYLAAASVRRRR